MRPHTAKGYGLTALLVMFIGLDDSQGYHEKSPRYLEPDLPKKEAAVFRDPRDVSHVDGRSTGLGALEGDMYILFPLIPPYSSTFEPVVNSLKLQPGRHTLRLGRIKFHQATSKPVFEVSNLTFLAQPGHVYSNRTRSGLPPVSLVDKTRKEIVAWVPTFKEENVKGLFAIFIRPGYIRRSATQENAVAVYLTDRSTALKRLGKPEQTSPDGRILLYRHHYRDDSRGKDWNYVVKLEFDDTDVLKRITQRHCKGQNDRVCHAKDPLCAMLKKEKEKTLLRTYCPA